MYAGAALIGVLAAAVAVPVFAFGQGGSGGGTTVKGNAVAVIDPSSDSVVGEVPVGARPGAIAAGSGSIWVANLDDQTVSRIDASKQTVSRTFPVDDTPTGLASSRNAVWVVGSPAGKPSVAVREIDPRFNTVEGHATSIGNIDEAGGSVATRSQRVWVAPSSGLLTRLDPRTARKLQQIDPNGGPSGIALGPDAAWFTDSSANTVTRLDLATDLLTPIAVGHGPSGIAVGAGSVWVADTLDDKVVRIDPGTRSATNTVPVGASPVGIAVGGGSVWVANSRDGTVTRIDAATATPRETIRVGGSPQGVVISNGRVWVTVQNAVASLAETGVAGGTLRATAQGDVDSMDPALAYSPESWELLYATCAKLLNYPDKAGPSGSRLVPEVAQALPERSRDGKTYTFTIRKGFRFSPPSDAPVTAQTFKYTIERSLNPRMHGPVSANGVLADVVGAQAYVAGRAPHVSGITARGNRLTVRLVAPAPDFVTRIALPFFCAVPVGTPVDPKGLRVVPGAGPYYVASYTPGQGIVLKRNPNYHGSRPHRLSRIELAVGVSKEKGVQHVDSGTADFAADGVPAGLARGLAKRYGPGSEAAKNGRQRYFPDTPPELDFYVLNTHRGIFRDVRLRRAVNYAIDRRALARLGDFYVRLPEHPTDQYLPPGMPGFVDEHIYPFTPDLAKARRLAGKKRRTAVVYMCSQCAEEAQIVKANLASIGIDAQVKTFPFGALFQRLARKGEPFDMAVSGWQADYPDPANFLNFQLLSGMYPPLDNPAYKRRLETAARLSGPARFLAYSKLDADLARNVAPWVAVGNASSPDFFSARMGCQVFQPAYGFIDLGALCIRR